MLLLETDLHIHDWGLQKYRNYVLLFVGKLRECFVMVAAPNDWRVVQPGSVDRSLGSNYQREESLNILQGRSILDSSKTKDL